jgi:hypothetical protein
MSSFAPLTSLSAGALYSSAGIRSPAAFFSSPPPVSAPPAAVLQQPPAPDLAQTRADTPVTSNSALQLYSDPALSSYAGDLQAPRYGAYSPVNPPPPPASATNRLIESGVGDLAAYAASLGTRGPAYLEHGSGPAATLHGPNYYRDPMPPAPVLTHGTPSYVSPVAVASSTPPVHFAHMPVQLTPDNYLFWRAQVVPLLRSHSLECFVDGTFLCPPPAHPAYRAWIAQDQTILSTLQSSLSEGVAGLVLFASTSREVWATLETNFSSQSSERSMAIRA